MSTFEPPLHSPSACVAAADRGDAPAAGALFHALYAELHRLARAQLARAPGRQAIDTTTLLHEVYLELSGREGLRFADQNHFLGYAARAMRGLIIDFARQRRTQKRGGRFELTSLGDDDVAFEGDGESLAQIGAALDELAGVEPELAQVVDLKFFCGLTLGEIASMKGLSERTVQRHWEKARLYLHSACGDGGAP
jgi:RNA polymerase sigma factor (TIGR02999 family)